MSRPTVQGDGRRSVRQIIAILELAQYVPPGVLKESTLSKQLRNLFIPSFRAHLRSLGNGIKALCSRAASGTGKQEKFFRFVDQSFVPEAYALIEQGKIQTLTDLNRFFSAWLEIAYHQKVHNSFKQRPMDRYQKDDHPIRTIPPHELAEVFFWVRKTKWVDRSLPYVFDLTDIM